jgi:integrase
MWVPSATAGSLKSAAGRIREPALPLLNPPAASHGFPFTPVDADYVAGARANWSRYPDTVFELAKVKDAHSHRFRDMFAVSLLENGVSLENLSVLLGHSSVRITERHYKP